MIGRSVRGGPMNAAVGRLTPGSLLCRVLGDKRNPAPPVGAEQHSDAHAAGRVPPRLGVHLSRPAGAAGRTRQPMAMYGDGADRPVSAHCRPAPPRSVSPPLCQPYLATAAIAL